MRTLGMVLLVLGTVIGTVGGAKLPTADWRIAGVGFGLLIAALATLRWPRGEGGAAAAGQQLDRVSAQVRELLTEVEKVRAQLAELPLPALVERLTSLERTLIHPIGDAYPKLLGHLGPHRFSDIFGTYARAERMLARAWSAAADQHQPEAHRSVEAALVQLRSAVELLGRAK